MKPNVLRSAAIMSMLFWPCVIVIIASFAAHC